MELKNFLLNKKEFLKSRYERTLEVLKIADQGFMVFLAVLVGILGGMGAVGIQSLIDIFSKLFFGGPNTEMVQIARSLPFWLLILIPALGGALVGPVIHFLAKEVKGHGVPEVIESVVKHQGIIRPRVAWVKALASSLCIGSGGSTGREGPIVQIGAAIASTVGQFFQLSEKRLKTLVGAGAAAGIAATFNAPITGALFAVEIILGDFGIAQMGPIVISSVVATVVATQLTGGDFPSFSFPMDSIVIGLTDLLPYVVLGLLVALVSVLFIRILYRVEELFARIPIAEYLKPILGGLCIGVLALSFAEILGTGHETIHNILEFLQGSVSILEFTWYGIFALVFVKMIATSCTLGSGGSGGVFAPSLFIGAMLGASFGLFAQNFASPLIPSSSAFPIVTMLVAMGSMIASTTHAPITAILIVLELTAYNYTLILPLMVTSVVSILFARVLKKESIYEVSLLKKGINIFAGREVNILKSISVRSVMRYDYAILPNTLHLNEIANYVLSRSYSNFLVQDQNQEILGRFSLNKFKEVMLNFESLKDVVIAEDLISDRMSFVQEDDFLDSVMSQFELVDTDELPVMDSSGKKVIGAVWRNDVIKSYNYELLKAEMASEVVGKFRTVEKIKMVEVLPGHSMAEIPVPKPLVGKTPVSSQVRNRYGTEIILVRKPDNTTLFPSGEYLFQREDRILLFGANDKIQRIQKL